MTYKGLKDDKSHNTHSDIWQFNKIVAYGITMIRLFIRLTKFQINTGFWFFFYTRVFTRGLKSIHVLHYALFIEMFTTNIANFEAKEKHLRVHFVLLGVQKIATYAKITKLWNIHWYMMCFEFSSKKAVSG